MENSSYAEKYADGAEKSDVLGKLKQASDARWVEGEDGAYFGGGALVAPDSGSWMGMLNVGREIYPWSWLSTRIGLDAIATNSETEFVFGGVDLGIRAQTPTRLAPFVGVGGGGGLSAGDMFLAVVDSHDNVDVDFEWDGMAVVYPECGAHFWLSGQLRFTAFARYMVTSAGREHDGWLIGGQLAAF